MANAYRNREYTYEEYLNWPGEQRIELIDGVIYDMSPGPSRTHQKIVGDIYYKIREYIESKGGKCEPYMAPLDVMFIEEIQQTKKKHVVQPDVFVVCDTSKMSEKGCVGASDLIIEVVSPGSKSRDYFTKAELYERFGVNEYVIVNYDKRRVLVYKLDENMQYNEPEIYKKDLEVEIGILEGLTLNFNDIL